ncbi:MAG: hypothetical protein ACRDQC_15380 [Gaiellales bacterium]
MSSRFPQDRADAFAVRLDLGLDTGVCLACLGIVCMAMDGGEPAKIRGALRAMSPELWMDALAEPALAAVRAAHGRGDPDAQAALEELERRGGRSTVAQAIVRHLAEKLRRQVRAELRVEALARPRLRLSPPEWN